MCHVRYSIFGGCHRPKPWEIGWKHLKDCQSQLEGLMQISVWLCPAFAHKAKCWPQFRCCHSHFPYFPVLSPHLAFLFLLAGNKRRFVASSRSFHSQFCAFFSTPSQLHPWLFSTLMSLLPPWPFVLRGAKVWKQQANGFLVSFHQGLLFFNCHLPYLRQLFSFSPAVNTIAASECCMVLCSVQCALRKKTYQLNK